MLEIYERLKKQIVGRATEIKSILVAMEVGKHILLEGPPGTSKSTILRKIAGELNILLHNYAVLAFNSGVCMLKEVDEPAGPEKVWARLFSPQSCGDTNIRSVLEVGLSHVSRFERHWFPVRKL
jgi:hypothetical protein